jgi:hypothetical protein
VHIIPTGTPERDDAQSDGLGMVVGSGFEGQSFEPPPGTIGDAHFPPEHTTTVLQRGSKSIPYSHRRPSFEQDVPCVGALVGQSGAFPGPGPASVSELVLPAQAIAIPKPTTTTPLKMVEVRMLDAKQSASQLEVREFARQAACQLCQKHEFVGVRSGMG